MSSLEKQSGITQVEQSISDHDLSKTETVDTVHNDEALKVLAHYQGNEEWTEQEEKQVLRRIDWKLLPILCITYGLQYYDKAMLSQAAIFGLRTDLKLTVGNRYSFSAAIFYLGFIVGAYPAVYLAQRFPIEKVASAIVTIWGVVLILTVACTNYEGIFAQRFFLGFMESGISPMFMMIVGSFYKKNEQAFRMGIWYACTGYVSVFSPLINYGLGQIVGSLSPWKYMYIFAGLLTIVWGVVLFWVLPPDPIRTKIFKDERQKYIAVARLRVNNAGVRNTHFKSQQLWELLTDVKFWMMFWIALLTMIANGPISTFVPIIIRGFGFNSLNSLLLVMPAGAYAGSMMLLLTWLAFRYKNIRSYLVCVGLAGTTLGALLIWLLPLSQLGGLLFGVIILPSIGSSYAVLMGLSLANVAGYTKRSLTSSGLFIGYCVGNLIGPLVFLEADAPRYPIGFIIVVVTCIAAMVLQIAYRFVCIRENRRRDAAGVMEGFDHAYEDDLTDVKNPQFRYIL